MSEYVCLIQEGQSADQKRGALAEGLQRIGQETFGDDPGASKVSWRVVKKGFAWTAGEPSTSSRHLRSTTMLTPWETNTWSCSPTCSASE